MIKSVLMPTRRGLRLNIACVQHSLQCLQCLQCFMLQPPTDTEPGSPSPLAPHFSLSRHSRALKLSSPGSCDPRVRRVHKTFGLTRDLGWWNLRWLITCRPGSAARWYSSHLDIHFSQIILTIFDDVITGAVLYFEWIESVKLIVIVKFVHHFSCYVI